MSPERWAERARRRLAQRSRTDGQCLVWTGALDRDGYGVTSARGHRQVRVHRLAYELAVGPIPAGLQLDHLCRVRACLRTEHLEPVPSRVNTLRGDSPTIRLHHLNECAAGHAYTDENTYRRTDGTRTCRTCMRRYKADFRARAQQREGADA